eukprot:gnl/TRDRNA2_/TRDRNA2_194066_c0_seq1.p1 gnl/TRDRNA2_/TRDRNA2_194066_c0~~gnl/TRDRNA2_/TRDRNA2_194066_c0_seq1.p1  ORF type:complete len:289 (+),score=42.08 gnl/TRDRNA2_/TRDRNA2_194066_c0_seq1:145-1011(+)
MGSHLAKLVFQPPESSYNEQQRNNLIWLHTDKSEVIPAFFIRREDARFTLLFSHGNAEDLGLIHRYFRELSSKLVVNVFSYEYTGYGMSTGQPQEANVYSDIEAAFRYVRDKIGIPWTKIIPYGRSIGTGPSVHLAMRTAVRGIVLQSPMVSIYRIPFKFRFTMPGDLFASIDKIGKVCCPVFIVHGTRDEIVPWSHGQGLYDAAAKAGIAYEPYWVFGADHNNLEAQAGNAFTDRFSKYLQYLENNDISERLDRQARDPACQLPPESPPQVSAEGDGSTPRAALVRS